MLFEGQMILIKTSRTVNKEMSIKYRFRANSCFRFFSTSVSGTQEFCDNYQKQTIRETGPCTGFRKHREVMNHFLSLELSTLCYTLMNFIVPLTNQVLPLLGQLTPWTRDRVRLLQFSYFSAPSPPCYKTPPSLFRAVLFSLHFRSLQESKIAARRT